MAVACVCACMMCIVECSDLLPEGGRDRIAKFFYHPVFAEGEQRASLGNLFQDKASADQDTQLGTEPGQSNLCNSPPKCSFLAVRESCNNHRYPFTGSVHHSVIQLTGVLRKLQI